MKQLLFCLLAFLIFPCDFAKVLTTSEVCTKNDNIKIESDSLTPEQCKFYANFTGRICLQLVDSLQELGLYSKAIDTWDSTIPQIESDLEIDVIESLYLRKTHILLSLERSSEVISSSNLFLDRYKEFASTSTIGLIYQMLGAAYEGEKNYQLAITSYEEAVACAIKMEDLSTQANCLCDIANCYNHLGKNRLTMSYYDKGIEKFLAFFETTRMFLVKKKIHVDDLYKQVALEVFSNHLLMRAFYELEHEGKTEAKEYFYMSAHCGNDRAMSEYQKFGK